ncbi:MAG: ABC transporter permease [Anaerolineaceae bacterium]|nr:ABC transporter permease [Anaerolineaceae bacterium]
MLVGSIPIAIAGVNPLDAYRELFIGAVGSKFGISETIVKSAPLILAGLGFAFAARCGLFNIGGEGQIYIGALGTVLVGLTVHGLTPWIAMPLAILAGGLFGSLWAAIPGALKARFGISEVITTIMFNYIGINVVAYLIRGPLVEPPGHFPETAELAKATWYPMLFGSRVHFGFIVALLFAALMYVVLWHTPLGYQVRAVGMNPSAAEYAGIKVKRSMIAAMMISGALAGLAGTNEMLGIQHRLIEAFSPGYGFDAIAVALLGQNHPLGIVLSGLLFSGLRAGAGAMQRAVGIPDAIVRTLQGLVVLFVIASAMLPQFIARMRSSRQEK